MSRFVPDKLRPPEKLLRFCLGLSCRLEGRFGRGDSDSDVLGEMPGDELRENVRFVALEVVCGEGKDEDICLAGPGVGGWT